MLALFRVGGALRAPVWVLGTCAVLLRQLLRVGGALRAPRRQSLLRWRYALLSAATPRMMGLRPQATGCRVLNVQCDQFFCGVA